MKKRGEDYDSVRIQGGDGGLQEKPNITGEEYILVEDKNKGFAVKIKDAVNNIFSSINFKTYFQRLLNSAGISSDWYDDSEVIEDEILSWKAKTGKSQVSQWPNTSYTIQDVSEIYPDYKSDGSELIALGLNKESNLNGTHTVKIPLSDSIENYISMQFSPKDTFSDDDIANLNLFANNFFCDIKIWDRLGPFSWLATMKVDGFGRKKEGNIIYLTGDVRRFDKDSMTFTTISVKDVEYFTFSTSKFSPSENEYHLNPSAIIGDASLWFDGVASTDNSCLVPFPINAKSSDIVYLWAHFNENVKIDPVLIASIPFYYIIDSESPSSYHFTTEKSVKSTDTIAFDFIKTSSEWDAIKSSKFSAIDDMAWLDCECDFTTNISTSTIDSNIKLFNFRVHQLESKDSGGYDDKTGSAYASRFKNESLTLMPISYDDERIFIVSRKDDQDKTYYTVFPKQLMINRNETA